MSPYWRGSNPGRVHLKCPSRQVPGAYERRRQLPFTAVSSTLEWDFPPSRFIYLVFPRDGR